MTQEWKPNGSNAEFWRSDNPLIAGWWRFGDGTPKNNFLTEEEQSPTSYLSGLMTDSGPQKHHLLPYYRSDDDAVSLTAVPGIAPWALSGSGCRINNNEDTGGSDKMLYADPAWVLQNQTSPDTHGTLEPGVVMYSGITVIGWVLTPQRDPVSTTERTIVGRSDQETSLSARLVWRISWQDDLSSTFGFSRLRATMQTQSNTTSPAGTTIQTLFEQAGGATGNPNFPRDRTVPFWFAAQFRREADEANRTFDGVGGGSIKLMFGTEASGLIGSIETAFTGPSVGGKYANVDLLNGVPLSFFNESRPAQAAQSHRRSMSSGTILDEVVIINDGFLPEDRVAHYALSGMLDVTTSNSESLDFVPEFPGSSGLVSYWSFDDDTGTNSAPETQDDPRLELSMSGVGSTISFIPGVNGGRAIRMTPGQASVFNSDSAALLNTGDYPAIPTESGLPLLWPSGQTVDEGMTVIGWARSVPTGTSMNGGAFGWFGANNARQTFWTDAYTSTDPLPNANVLSTIIQISGAPAALPNDPLVRFTSHQSETTETDRPGRGLGLTNSSTRSTPQYDSSDDGWHLWAGIFDIHAGMVYMVKDAKHTIMLTQQMFTSQGLLSNNFGPTEGFFGFTPRDTGSWEIDNFAVYNRILSIPEMSGFALGGIASPSPDAVLSTPMKSLVGYWPLDEFVNYDPTFVSGFRIDDDSWYSHHLTNVSGAFSFGSRLNSEVSTVGTSLNVDLSGSMISLERSLHGTNLDGSDTNQFATSGMAAGAWVYIPYGDLGSEGQGSSGLDGDHMIMGAWSQEASEQSWFLGIRDNKAHVKFRDSETSTLTEYTSPTDVEFNTPFFIGCNLFGSGLFMTAQVVQAASASDSEIEYVIDEQFGLSDNFPQAVGASGFSILNAPNLDYGFPQTTRIGLAFVHMGHLDSAGWIATKRSAIDNITLTSGSVSTSDQANISHWRFDKAGNKVLDFGKENNALFPINTDGHKVGVEGSVHSSGVVVRRLEYLDTIPSNPGSRRLDLGSGTQSWTMLTWLKPPIPSATDLHVIMNKGSGPSVSPTGIKVFTPQGSLAAQALAANSSASGQNGDLAPQEWNHLAVTYDRDNNEFGVIVNARYAGTSFISLGEIAPNNSGLSLGGRGDQEGNAINGGSAFSGVLDDTMLFSRVLTLPEISGLAANSYNFTSNAGTTNSTYGMWLSGINQEVVSGMIGSYMHGLGQDIDLFAGYVSGVSGVVDQWGGYIHGRAFVSGLTGGFTHGIGSQSGIFGHFMHGQGIVSGLIGSYTYGACQAVDEFDVTLTFEIVTSKDFDARLGVEKTEIYGFDSRLGVIRITQPPVCTLEVPEIGLIASGTPYTLTVQGSGIAQDNKKVSKVRFTFADFKKGEDGALIDGVLFSGLYQASRTFETPGLYNVAIEVLDSYGYRSSCVREFLLVPSGSESGTYLASLPSISISGTPLSGSAIHRVFFTHHADLETTSGILEYTNFCDQQESLMNSMETPSGTQFANSVKTHDYTMPGHYNAVWAVSGSWGIVSTAIGVE